MILSRELGKRIWGGSSTNTENGGGGVSSDYIAGLLTGYATESWVDEHYISIDFFSRLFQAHGTENGSEIDVLPNDMDTTITSVESMFGFWTNLYISALGSNGAAPAGISLGMLTDVTISGTPSAGQVLTFDAVSGMWVNGNGGASSLATLTDVTLSQVQNGDTLLYDSTTSKWYNSALKTINGQSLLGSGDISVGGGASGNYLPLSGGTLTNSTYGGCLHLHRPVSGGNVAIKFSNDNDVINRYLGFDTSKTADKALYVTGNNNTPYYYIVTSGMIPSTIWGQSFGSGDIIGDMSSVGNISTYSDFNVRTPSTSNQARIQLGYPAETASYAFTNVRFTPFAASNGLLDLGRDIARWKDIYGNTLDLYSTSPALIKLKRNNSGGGAYIDFYGLNQDSNYWRVGGELSFIIYNNSTSRIRIDISGNVGIGVDSPSYKLHVAGTIYATGAITALSDARKKDITGEAGVTVEQIAHAPAVQFLWKDKERRKEGQQVGTLAQYWQTVLPEVVSDKGGELSMQYGVAALVSAIVTARKVVDHEQRITELENENERLKTEIEQLRLN